MRCFLVLALPMISALAQPSQRDICVLPADIARVEVVASTVEITFSPSSHSDALAKGREFTIGIGFPLEVANSPFISEIRWVADRVAGISLKFATPKEAKRFAQGIRDGDVHLATHEKT